MPKYIKNLRPKSCMYWGGGILFLIIISLLMGYPRLGKGVPAPQLSISLTDTNTVVITVINDTNNSWYEIFSKDDLGDSSPWIGPITGANGTNFVLDLLSSGKYKFWRAGVSNDWDNDGIPNYQDGNPLNSSIGILSVTIDSPTAGQDIH